MSGPLMTAEEVAGMLGVPTSWVYEQSRRGRIPTVTLGRYRRYRRDAVEAWIEELEAAGVATGRRHRLASTAGVDSQSAR
jgi:excisionase family DNA binding protein